MTTTPTDPVAHTIAFNPKQHLRGIVASLHTPFTASDDVDFTSLARLVGHATDAGCRAVLVAAVAGEVESLSEAERESVLRCVVESAQSRLIVIAGISANSIDDSVNLATTAAAYAVPMVMWQAPTGITAANLIDALLRIADKGNHQIMLQDLDWVGPGLSPQSIVEALDAVPALTAVKVETVPAGPKYSAIQALTQDRLHLSGGWAATQMLDGLARGLDAFIPSGLLSEQVRIFDRFQAGDLDGAREAFEKILPIVSFSNQHIDVSRRFWKRVRVCQGIFGTNRCRESPPLDPVQHVESERLCQRVLDIEPGVSREDCS